MIYIDPESAVRGEVLRLTTTLNNSGAVIAENFTQIFGLHWCDVQPLSDQERFANEKINLKASHKIYPEVDVVASVLPGDFYRIDSDKIYRIVEAFDYKKLGYFRVWEGGFGTTTSATISTERFYTLTDIPPGVYTFGSGLVASVPPFASTPILIPRKSNDSDFYISSVSATGFTLVDRLEGESPLATIYIQGTH